MTEPLQCKTENKRNKWYNGYSFPLVPIFEKKEGNNYNTVGYSFQWLCFRFWTLDSFAFEVGAVIDTHWGIGFIGILPYLRWVIAIPFHWKLQNWTQQTLWRKPKIKD